MSKPTVTYVEVPKDQVFGRDFFEVIATESDDWAVGDTFSDDDMSMGSVSVVFVQQTEKSC